MSLALWTKEAEVDGGPSREHPAVVSQFPGDADDTEALRSGGTRVQGDQAKIHTSDSRGSRLPLKSSSPRTVEVGEQTVDAESISTSKLGAVLKEMERRPQEANCSGH